MGLKITLDPGHVKGYNPGVIPGYAEGNMTWRLAQLLKTELERYAGIDPVAITRPAIDVDMELETRGKVAAKNGSDLFISLHSDGFPSPEAKGVTVFYSQHRPDSIKLGDALGRCVTNLMDTIYRGAKTRSWGTAHPDWDYYGVIRGAVGADGDTNVQNAFLIEHGFHTNPEDCAWLCKDTNLEWLVKCEAEIIAKYYGLIINPPTGGALYRVQVGAFGNKQNAERLAEELRGLGYQTLIKSD